MNSSVKIAAMVAVLAAFTAPLKFVEQTESYDDLGIVTAEIVRFLVPLSETPLETVRLFTTTSDFSGWRFSLDGGEAMAFPAPAIGGTVKRAELLARPDDRISFVFEGELRDSPPVFDNARNVIADRLLAPVGLIERPDRYMVLLIAPEHCADRIESLGWPSRLQAAG